MTEHKETHDAPERKHASCEGECACQGKCRNCRCRLDRDD